VRGNLVAGGLVMLLIGGVVVWYYSGAYSACNSAVGELYQLLGGQDCNTVYTIFYIGVLLAIVGLILAIVGAATSETPPPAPAQVIYVQPAQPYAQSQPRYASPPVQQPGAVAPSPTPAGPAAVRFCSYCGAPNRATASFCETCGKPFAPPLAPIANPDGQPPPSPVGETYCPSCGVRNPSSRTSCGLCGRQLPSPTLGSPPVVPPQPASASPQPTLPSEWVCPSCGVRNPSSKTSCGLCGAPLLPPPPGSAAVEAPPPASSAAQPPPPPVRYCPACGCGNPRSAAVCSKCGKALRPLP
jgi:ribosomal protein L40E